MAFADWKRWSFAIVPAAGLVELGAHALQTRSPASDADWSGARAYVAAHAKPEDLVAFAPRWADPIGRKQFGADLATIAREARPDETRFARAFEVSLRGAHLPVLSGWRRSGERRFGGVTVTTWDNPSPAKVIDDLVSMVDPRRMRVSRGGTVCPFLHGSPLSGGLGFGLGIPADRFVCNAGGFVGVSVVPDLNYVPHQCIYAPPPGGAPLRIHFDDVAFGRVLHGHDALYVEAERGKTGAPVTIAFRAGDTTIGSVTHYDGDGWKPFEFDTSSLAGQRGELVAEVSAPSGDRRMVCFEADTR